MSVPSFGHHCRMNLSRLTMLDAAVCRRSIRVTSSFNPARFAAGPKILDRKLSVSIMVPSLVVKTKPCASVQSE